MPEKTPINYTDNPLFYGDEQPLSGSSESRDTKTVSGKVLNSVANARPARRRGNIRPIILSLALVMFAGFAKLNAQINGSISLSAGYSDNVFQLSDYDISRFEADHSNLEFAKTTDDVTLGTRIELAYPLSYRWWKFTPSVVGSFSQNVSNTDKYRRDAAFKLRVDRYYWNATAQYAYNPHIYYRDFTDSDGSSSLEDYTYSRNTYRLDAAVKPFKNTTVKANIRMEDYYYNEFFTEADGTALTGGLAASYRFPDFTVELGYDYRDFANDNKIDNDDASYESNIYKGKFILPKMPLDSKSKTMWQPALGLNYEQRYYQGDGSWYGGRADYTYTMNAGFDLIFSPKWNLSLDYTHLFRNVESNNDELIKLKEYSENKLGAALGYKF